MKPTSDARVTITAVVTRADGTIEDHGIVCTNDPQAEAPLRRLLSIMKESTRAR
jgi:hypothetical protein